MSNIVINTHCNLHCPYCFGDDYVENKQQIMSDGTFRKAKEFILGGQTEASVGIIGGEPTLHPHFSEFVIDLCKDDRVSRVIVYTNGILLTNFPKIISESKVKFLINCNPPDIIGKEKYNKLAAAISLIARYPDRLSLGVNLYKERTDYSYIYDLLEIAKLPRLRVSITVPNNHLKNEPFSYFSYMKPVVLEFFCNLANRGVIPYFDCNHLPPCFVDPKDLAMVEFNKELLLLLQNTLWQTVSCRPVIDIFPDLTAVRCLGMSESTKVKIADFANINDLFHFYLREVDAFAYHCTTNDKCRTCYKLKTTKCSGGCLSYKSAQIQELKELCEKTVCEGK